MGCGDERERCCRDSCCPTQFYRAWTQFSCVTDQQCQEWKTGQSCCLGGKCCSDLPTTTLQYQETERPPRSTQTVIINTDSREIFYTTEDDYNPARTEDIRTSRHSNKPTSPASQVVASLPLKNTARAARNGEDLAVLATLIILTFRVWSSPVIINSETQVWEVGQDGSTCSVWIIDCYSFFTITRNERVISPSPIVYSILIVKLHQTGANFLSFNWTNSIFKRSVNNSASIWTLARNIRNSNYRVNSTEINFLTGHRYVFNIQQHETLRVPI